VRWYIKPSFDRVFILSIIFVPKITEIGQLLLKLSLVVGWYPFLRHMYYADDTGCAVQAEIFFEIECILIAVLPILPNTVSCGVINPARPRLWQVFSTRIRRVTSWTECSHGWSACNTPFTRYNRLADRLYNDNRFDNRLNVCIHDTTSCQKAKFHYAIWFQPSSNQLRTS